MASPEKPYKGNPEFPNVNPVVVTSSTPTNDTQVYYMIDPDGQAVELGAVLNEDGTSASIASQTINTPKYGRFVNINVASGTLYAYPWVDASGTN